MPSDQPLGSFQHDMSFPESVYAAFLMPTPEYSSRTFRFVYQSLVTPNSVYDFDMAVHKQTLLKRQEVLGGYIPDRSVTERQGAIGRFERRRWESNPLRPGCSRLPGHLAPASSKG